MSTPHSIQPQSLGRRARAKTRRPPFRAARAFYITLFLGICLATYALFLRPWREEHVSPSVRRRQELGVFQSADEECRLVHRAENQCAFIKKHCPDDEAGFTAYLQLFYCTLPHAKPVAFVILIAWLGLLFSTIGIAASDFFCINLSTIAGILGMSESMAGVTFLAFGNGSPDVFSTFVAMSTDSGSLAIGELFGAAGFITAVVAGSMALIRPFHVAKKSFIRDVSFFTVAAAFSMYFLWDGRLHLWECIVMVVFYVFYVAFVVVWHWYLGRRRRRREKEAAARGHFLTNGDELDLEEEYHDDPEEGEGSARPGVSRDVSREDWSALERGGLGTDGADEDDEEEARDRWMSELSSNMRLTRHKQRSRNNTLSTVRPSLVGALEFQAVLKSLQKSRNHQTIPLNTRRYSDDPAFTTAQQQEHMASVSDPAARPPFQIKVEDGTAALERPSLSLDVPKSVPGRFRAVSVNDISSVRVDSDLQRLSATSSRDGSISPSTHSQTRTSLLGIPGRSSLPQSPSVEISPAPLEPHGPPSINPTGRSPSPDHLAPPSAPNTLFRQLSDSFAPRGFLQAETPQDSPTTVPMVRTLPRIVIPRMERTRSGASTPSSSPFPRFHDDLLPVNSKPPSLNLPPPLGSPDFPQAEQNADLERVPSQQAVSWWPHSLMPPPQLLISTLFPTVYNWRDKNWWEKCLGVVAAPSVFLLTATLPVVENEKDGESLQAGEPKNLSLDSARSKSLSGALGQNVAGLGGLGPEDNEEDSYPGTHRHSLSAQGVAGHGATASVAVNTERHHHHDASPDMQRGPSITLDHSAITASPALMPKVDDSSQAPELWNRWLTIVQLFTAPLFITLSIYSQGPTEMSPRWLVKPALICLLVSLILLIPLLLTTTPTHRPAVYRTMLSLAGFVVSIAWISTIAAQVVGALKALAVILNMSHAIMGLTIFAVGNSLGDLVADVTVAKLGYPVMALSACFGGPMLNILLGIGLSGSWILIRGAEGRKHRHPEKDIKFHTYHIDVSNTLIVSGATLLITLVGLLIFVPLNKWVLNRRIGWCLIAVWVLSTTANVVLEVTGWAGEGSEG